MNSGGKTNDPRLRRIMEMILFARRFKIQPSEYKKLGTKQVEMMLYMEEVRMAKEERDRIKEEHKQNAANRLR